MHLADYTDLAARCRQSDAGLVAFRAHPTVARLRWPTDVVEQWLYDHSGHRAFLTDYGHVELSDVHWRLEAHDSDELVAMPTGASDEDLIDDMAAGHQQRVEVRDSGEHVGVKEMWEVHGTWKRWPLLIDRALLDPSLTGLQVIEGRTRVGVLKGRQRDALHVAERHLAWVARLKD